MDKDLFPKQAEALSRMHPEDDSYLGRPVPNGQCPACGGELCFTHDSTSVDDSTPMAPTATVRCQGCHTRYTVSYLADKLEPILEPYPVNTKVVVLHEVVDQDETAVERVTPPCSIWGVESLDWSAAEGDLRSMVCPKTGASGFWSVEEMAETRPLNHPDLLKFEHDGFEVVLPHRDCGASWNPVDPQVYGFELAYEHKNMANVLLRNLPAKDGGYLALTNCHIDRSTGNLRVSAGSFCVLERWNAHGELVSSATLAQLEDNVLRERAAQSPDDILDLQGFIEKYEALGGQHPEHTRQSWMMAVAADETINGYWAWAHHLVMNPESAE